jgi:hypothetical protein
MTSQTSLTRNSYGELLTNSTTTTEHRALIAGAWNLVKLAGKKVPAAYDNMSWERISSRIGNKRTGEALHHELYDVTPTGSKVLLCCREVEGTRYGIKTLSKTYYLLTRHGKGVKVAEANKAVVAKAAKAAGNVVGYAIEVIEGKSRLQGKALEKRQGYKALTLDTEGAPISVWDESPWTLGKTRTEKATDDHTGGFYYYATLDEVLASAHKGEIFGDAREHRNLVIARVEAWGNEIVHYGGKRCVTHIKPLEIIASVTV